MARHKNVNWKLPEGSVTWEQAQLAVLMDLRDELKLVGDELRIIRSQVCCDNARKAAIAVQQLSKHTKARWPLKTKTVKR